MTRQPRYEEIAAYVGELVQSLEPGARLPSEAELCARFGVSRMTARHAVSQLVNQGLVHRNPGQGTFVSPRRVPRLLGSPLSFTESMRQRGMATTSVVLDTGPIAPSPEDVGALDLGPGDRPVLLERLRLVDGVPMAIERAVITPSCSAVLDADLAVTSLHDGFRRLGRHPAVAVAKVSARRARASERRLLELGSSGTVLCERRVISDQDGIPLEHTETRYAAERYEFETVLFEEQLAPADH